jgi:hypothetical protein
MGTADTQQESYTKYIFLNDPPKPSRNLAHQDSDQTNIGTLPDFSPPHSFFHPLGQYRDAGEFQLHRSILGDRTQQCGFLVGSPKLMENLLMVQFAH